MALGPINLFIPPTLTGPNMDGAKVDCEKLHQMREYGGISRELVYETATRGRGPYFVVVQNPTHAPPRCSGD